MHAPWLRVESPSLSSWIPRTHISFSNGSIAFSIRVKGVDLLATNTAETKTPFLWIESMAGIVRLMRREVAGKIERELAPVVALAAVGPQAFNREPIRTTRKPMPELAANLNQDHPNCEHRIGAKDLASRVALECRHLVHSNKGPELNGLHVSKTGNQELLNHEVFDRNKMTAQSEPNVRLLLR